MTVMELIEVLGFFAGIFALGYMIGYNSNEKTHKK